MPAKTGELLLGRHGVSWFRSLGRHSTLKRMALSYKLHYCHLFLFFSFFFFYKDCHLFLDERKKNARGLANGFTVTNQFGTVNTLCHSSIKYGR
jgi:hypothetical protein